MIRVRHADEWVGFLVLVTTLVFLGIVLQAGVLRDWFRTVSVLRIVLPETGVAGMAVGADVEVLGTKAGTVRRIVIDPSQQMYAEAEIDDQARAFIRRDSQAVIRRRFGVAGAAFVDISRGTGQPLDWKYAVIQATTERAPTEDVGALIDQVREKVFPILDNFEHATHALADTMERIDKGEGDIGRLLTDESMVRSLENTADEARDAVARVGRITDQLEVASKNVTTLTETLNARNEGVPAVLRRANDSLASLQDATRDLALAMQQAPQITHNVESASRDLPTLIIQVQQTAHELEQLLAQLRSLWLLGGGASAPPVPATPLPSTEVRP
ncbi:MAG TPA: MlaD family protein [Alphaproteobacteria bacterium]|nr:MlaD family protein [Alphaproteobacteria bacterium]